MAIRKPAKKTKAASRARVWRRRLGKRKKREQADDVDQLTFVMAGSER
jgi:hypothetical protein